MNWFRVFAKGHHGYPQPEDSYESELYETSCLRCGIHGKQNGYVHLRSPGKALNSHFIQPNWLFDVFLVRPEVESVLTSENIQNLEFWPVYDSKKKCNSEYLRQMVINTVISCAETEKLPKVSCKQNNEESSWESPGQKRYSADTPYCGSVKYHPPTKLVVEVNALTNTADIFQTAEWFGSGSQSYRITICSEKFMSLAKSHKFRGLGFKQIYFEGKSERGT